jgi:hypothetical protein
MSDRIPTLGDICSAIAEGHLTATSDGSVYQVSVRELRRYLNYLRSLPANAVQSPSSPTDPATWSGVAKISVA